MIPIIQETPIINVMIISIEEYVPFAMLDSPNRKSHISDMTKSQKRRSARAEYLIHDLFANKKTIIKGVN
jgi:hypothetical protein